MRALLAAVLAAAVADAAAARVRTTLIVAPGETVSHHAAAPVLTVTPVPRDSKAVAVRFERYRQDVQVTGKVAGETKLLLEHADNRIGEVLDVTVVPPAVKRAVASTLDSLSGVEGIGSESIHVAGTTIVVAGTVYSVDHLRRCDNAARDGRAGAKVLCVARLSGAAAAVAPGMTTPARASVKVVEEAPEVTSTGAQQSEGVSSWRVTVRLGDVPVVRAISPSRQDIVGRAAGFAEALNRMVGRWREQSTTRAPYPVDFRSACGAQECTVSAVWSYEQGRSGETLGKFPRSSLARAAEAVSVPLDQAVSWWTMLMEDAFRLYYQAERPVRSGTKSLRSPLLALYEQALRLNGAPFSASETDPLLARAFFSLQLSTGEDPFSGVLVQVPQDFEPAGR